MIPEDYQSQCNRMRELLDDIANGDLAVPLPSGAVNDPFSTTDGQEKVFTRSKHETGTGDLRNPDEDHSLDVI